jgi:hypothetical protein
VAWKIPHGFPLPWLQGAHEGPRNLQPETMAIAVFSVGGNSNAPIHGKVCVAFFLWGNMEEIHTCVYCILHISVVFYGIPYSHIAYIILAVPSMRTNLRRHDIICINYTIY